MKKRRLISVLLVLVLLMSTMTSFAAKKEGITYTALGDSIAYGIGGTKNIGYTDLFNDYLEKVYGEGNFIDDFSISGMTSSDLLSMLSNTESVQVKVQNSDIITISIGGNDVLKPLIGAISNLAEHGKIIEDLNDSELKILVTSLGVEANISNFYNNWTRIVGIIGVNIDAKIIVNTIYNPFKPGDLKFEIADKIILKLNDIIWSGDSVYYQVADVYTEFSEYNNKNKVLVHDLSSLYAIHPTDLGYKFIYNLHKDLMD